MNRTVSSFLFLFLLGLLPQVRAASGGTVIDPYGKGTAGRGGFTPVIWAEGHPSPGNSSFKITMDKGLGGGPAFLLMSTRSSSLKILGMEILADPSAPLFLVPWNGLLSGTPGGAGAGSAKAPLPIPNNPSLAGLEVFFQFLGGDGAAPAGLSASDGLRVTLQRGPLVVGVGYKTLVSYNPATKKVTNMGGIVGPVDAQFDRKGDLLFLADRKVMRIFDARVVPFSLLKTVNVPGGQANHVVVHPNGKRAYVSVASRTTPAIYIVDIDRGSSTFGTVLGKVKGLPPGYLNFEGGSVSADGKVLCVCDLGLGSKRWLHIVDVDPTSPTRDQVKKSILIPGISGFATDVEVGPRGVVAYLCFSTLSKNSYYARVFLPAGQVMNTLQLGSNALFPADIDLDPRGRFLIVSCPNSSNLVKIDLTPGPGFFKGTIFQTAPGKAKPFSVALTPDGRTAWAMTMNKGLFAWDTATGKVVQSVPIHRAGAAVAVR